MTARGGRIPAQGRPSQAPGVGRNAKRHDLENPRTQTPPLHGSSGIQQGDIQAMEQGQRMRGAQTQGPAQPPPIQGGGGGPAGGMGGGGDIPDMIDFIGARTGGDLRAPETRPDINNSKVLAWMPLMRKLAQGPGASPALVTAVVRQARHLMDVAEVPATVIDLNDMDFAVEAMLDADEPQQMMDDEMEDTSLVDDTSEISEVEDIGEVPDDITT